jgi:predicted DNA-binding helix-hairpin-helix protein
MGQHLVIQKLEILSDAAKYDASCASSGATTRDSNDGKGLEASAGRDVCHAYALDDS